MLHARHSVGKSGILFRGKIDSWVNCVKHRFGMLAGEANLAQAANGDHEKGRSSPPLLQTQPPSSRPSRRPSSHQQFSCGDFPKRTRVGRGPDRVGLRCAVERLGLARRGLEQQHKQLRRSHALCAPCPRREHFVLRRDARALFRRRPASRQCCAGRAPDDQFRLQPRRLGRARRVQVGLRQHLRPSVGGHRGTVDLFRFPGERPSALHRSADGGAWNGQGDPDRTRCRPPRPDLHDRRQRGGGTRRGCRGGLSAAVRSQQGPSRNLWRRLLVRCGRSRPGREGGHGAGRAWTE